jgi:hypothetical protein
MNEQYPIQVDYSNGVKKMFVSPVSTSMISQSELKTHLIPYMNKHHVLVVGYVTGETLVGVGSVIWINGKQVEKIAIYTKAESNQAIKLFQDL